MCGTEGSEGRGRGVKEVSQIRTCIAAKYTAYIYMCFTVGALLYSIEVDSQSMMVFFPLSFYILRLQLW